MNTALLIIDVQHGPFHADPPPFEAGAVIERINSLGRRARAAGVPVILARHEDGARAQGSAAWQLDGRLDSQPGDTVLDKATPDAFFGTSLLDLLLGWRTEEIVLCGYATEFSVDTTARRAAALGFPLRLAADAHTTHDKPHASAAWIREHHNRILPGVGQMFGAAIRALPHDSIDFAVPR